LKKTIFYIALLSATACVKELPFPDKPIQKGVVLNAFLTAGEVAEVQVTESFAPGETNKPLALQNAIVDLLDSSDNLLETLLFDPQSQKFKGSLPLHLGQKYSVKVSKPNLEFLAKATDRFPLSKPTVIADTSTVFFQGRPHFFQFDLIVTDDPKERNYYLFYAMEYYTEYVIRDNQIIDSIHKVQKSELSTNDFWFIRNANKQYSQKELLLLDQGFSGQVAFTKMGLFISRKAERRTKKVVLYFHALSPAHYLYTASLNEQLFYQSDPFSQSGTVFSNVKGGFGVVGCNAKDSLVWIIE
jgi:hypothetical protein